MKNSIPDPETLKCFTQSQKVKPISLNNPIIETKTISTDVPQEPSKYNRITVETVERKENCLLNSIMDAFWFWSSKWLQ